MADPDESLVPQRRELSEIPQSPSLVPRQWELAWDEFGLRHPRLKHGSSFIAFLVFTGLGQSVLGLIQLIYAIVPLFGWPLMFLATTVLAQMFVIRFSGLAHERMRAEIEVRLAAVEEHLKPKLEIFYERRSPYFLIEHSGWSGEIEHFRSYFRIEFTMLAEQILSVYKYALMRLLATTMFCFEYSKTQFLPEGNVI